MAILELRAAALENELYRAPLYVKEVEVTAYALRQNEKIAYEVHRDATQLIYVVEGAIDATINGITQEIQTDHMLIIPAGMGHEIRPSRKGFSFSGYTKFFSVYTRPQHVINDIAIREGL